MGAMMPSGWTMASVGWMLGLEYNQNQRSNHLHKENLAQILRIHEAETYAAMEYHRVAMKMAYEQHEKGILQARIMHEEDMDLEKRIAVRENLRDEWTQLTERAGTVLIVNTLVLGVAFGMLVDGPLPESITLTHHTLVVAYFCLLSSAINLLLCSVRFAMLLRFRIGLIIVAKMKDAIKASTTLDKQFRENALYKKINNPAVTKPVCDDEERKSFVQPLTAQMGLTHETKQKGADDKEQDHLAFVIDMPSSEYRDLHWLSHGTGYAAVSSMVRDAQPLYRTLDAVICRRRAQQVKEPSIGEQQSSRYGKITIAEGPAADATRDTASSSSSAIVPPAPSVEPALDANTHRQEEEDGAGRPEGHHAETSRRTLRSQDSRISDFALDMWPKYKEALRRRLSQEDDLKDELINLRDQLCRPWDLMAQWLFFGGSVCLIIASCLLVLGRWGFHEVPLPPGADAFPASKMAAWGFCSPCVVTVLVLVWVKYRNDRNDPAVPAWLDGRDEASSPKSPRTHDMQLPVITEEPCVRHQEMRMRRTSTSNNGGPKEGTEDALHYRLPQRAGILLSAFSLANFLAFLLAALLNGPPELQLASITVVPDTQEKADDASSKTASSSSTDSNAAVLTPIPLALAWGTTWPAFWEPTGATWWPRRRELLLVGGMNLVELHVDGLPGRNQGPSLSVPRQLTEMSSLADVCVVSNEAADDSGGDNIWLASTDSGFTIFRADEVATVERGGLVAKHLFPHPESAPGRGSDTSALPVGVSRVIRAMACSHAWGSETESTAKATHLWLAANEGPWPTVIGAKAGLANRSTATAPSVLRWTDAVYRWPVQWLVADRAIANVFVGGSHAGTRSAALAGGVTVESIEAIAADGLLMLLTSTGDGSIGQRKLQQLLVAVSSSGHVRKWWIVAPPGGIEHTPAATLGVGRWIAVAVDLAGRRLFLVAGGPRPIVSTVPLPDW